MPPQFLETMKMAQQVATNQVEFEVVYSQHKGNGRLPSSIFLEHDSASIESDDDHLVEFSEALRTVAKTFRRVEEGKASAQAEAAEWKRKYELERARNLQWMQRDSLFQDIYRSSEAATKKTFLQCKFTSPEENGFDNEGHIQDTIRSENTESKPVLAQNAFINKAHCKLSRGQNRERNGEHMHDVVSFGKGNIITAEGNNKQIMLRWETRPQAVLILTKPNSSSVSALCSEMVRWLKVHKGIDIYVEPRVRSELLMDEPNLSFVRSWDDDKEVQILHTKVDMVITLGGDGTVLWAASLFKGPVPLIVPFSMGSLGFMTPFQSENYRDCLESIIKGPVKITPRNRLQCQIIRDDVKDELKDEQPILVLNEVTIDRGLSSFLTNLECYCDDSFVTCVQGDGLILSTTSGSTAYSLAAGGSMVHPQVPGILFTPICPHSLSFRPLILPDSATIRVQVPFNSRGHAWASFDGKNRKELAPGDALIVNIAPWPVPTACLVDSTNDFFRSIHDGLHWNLRKSQSFDGPRES